MPYQFIDHLTHLEIRLEGVVDDSLVFDADVLERVADVRRILIDYSGVVQMHLDSTALAEKARKNEAAGLKVAVFAPNPAMFGFNRQVLQLAGVREGETVCVFDDLAEARDWLLSG